jgi:serine/threonine-protein kinase RsbW
VTRPSQLYLRCEASPDRAMPLRHALGAFLAAVEVDRAHVDDVLTAVGEALANVIEHAYKRHGVSAAEMELLAHADDASALRVDVVDYGCFVKRPPQPNRGFGLRIVRAIAREVSIDATERGTRVRMLFDVRRSARAVGG